MSYVKITNGAVAKYPYSTGHLRRDNPNVSFPRNISAEIMRSYDMHPVITETIPDYNPLTQKVTTATTPTYNGNDWVITHTVVNLTSEEISEQDAIVAEANRYQRNERLAATDYLALSDMTLSAEMTTYRQVLRDITTHANWPHLEESDWPTKP